MQAQDIQKQLIGWGQVPTQHESLPGQMLLFPPLGSDVIEVDTAATEGSELFYTGKDLPGSNETIQAILWDLSDAPIS